MTEKHFYDRVKNVLHELEVAQEDGKISLAEAAKIGFAVIEVAGHAVDASMDDDHFQELIDQTERVYDDFIAPYDIKWIPDFIEDFVDMYIRSMIGSALVGIREKLLKKEEDQNEN